MPFGRLLGDDLADLAGKGACANLVPAIVFFPISKLALRAPIGELDYFHFNIKASNSSFAPAYKNSDFGADFGLSQLLLSGTFYFGRWAFTHQRWLGSVN